MNLTGEVPPVVRELIVTPEFLVAICKKGKFEVSQTSLPDDAQALSAITRWDDIRKVFVIPVSSQWFADTDDELPSPQFRPI